MTLNLDALDAFDDLDRLSAAGKPLQLALPTVHEDPDQPRKTFDARALEDLTDSIRQSGVKSPVSVRAHPSRPGEYILNFGARRLRASKAAGKSTIPAFIDETHGDYEQVVENLQRDGLTPMELAMFIGRKLESGAKKGDIARYLGVDLAIITRHLALIDTPALIEDVYRSGRCTSPQTLYYLRAAFEQNPNQVTAWVSNDVEITRKSVDALRRSLTGSPTVEEKLDHGQIFPSGEETIGLSPGTFEDVSTGKEKSVDRGQVRKGTDLGGFDHGQISDVDNAESDAKSGSPNAMAQRNPRDTSDVKISVKANEEFVHDQISSSPVLRLKIGDRIARALLDHRPTITGHLFVQWADDNEIEQVRGERCSIISLGDI